MPKPRPHFRGCFSNSTCLLSSVHSYQFSQARLINFAMIPDDHCLFLGRKVYTFLGIPLIKYISIGNLNSDGFYVLRFYGVLRGKNKDNGICTFL
ncbi:hypothetical protein K450DRAFT_229755 [Umbelopsis ramanniana AG]|uniref:Uncharacterized protein n=1 Tax=Umbelopsis ramanniana AG TaxID=1314678 RepID=A0AAD5EDH9_UMBRA|nr:uncharacterized protein K450DRAFT_229755 [Umbelopsis ramanniana AG]KAI8581893.1 hypothetical protein K450DRAFT_229755 [Umbelopsis ramanniana AG]